MSTATPSINEKIAWLVRAKGLTQVDLSRRLGIRPSHLSTFLRGHAEIRSGLFVDLLKEVGVDIPTRLDSSLASSQEPSLGRQFEALVGGLQDGDREALIGYIARFAEENLRRRDRNKVEDFLKVAR
jgi:transcriptional regulator with XRE-family HTH domain